jgi:hypothetical protein
VPPLDEPLLLLDPLPVEEPLLVPLPVPLELPLPLLVLPPLLPELLEPPLVLLLDRPPLPLPVASGPASAPPPLEEELLSPPEMSLPPCAHAAATTQVAAKARRAPQTSAARACFRDTSGTLRAVMPYSSNDECRGVSPERVTALPFCSG